MRGLWASGDDIQVTAPRPVLSLAASAPAFPVGSQDSPEALIDPVEFLHDIGMWDWSSAFGVQ